MLCRLMIDLFSPTAANFVEPTGANWLVVPLEWLLRAAGYSPSATIGALYTAGWSEVIVHVQLRNFNVPRRWQLIAQAWNKLPPSTD